MAAGESAQELAHRVEREQRAALLQRERPRPIPGTVPRRLGPLS